MKLKEFTPLAFLASLGAGGIAIMPFVLMQYTLEHGKGLITQTQLWANNFVGLEATYYISLELVMIIFTIIHFVLTIYFTKELFVWWQKGNLSELINDPIKNTAILAPLISILMTMNVFIGPMRYFLLDLQVNLQSLFLPAALFWSMMFLIVILTEIKLLGISFRKGFDIDKINFGWLLHPFVLGMLTVVGTGIAAMSNDILLADSVAFLTLISGSMGVFLLIVKMIVLF